MKVINNVIGIYRISLYGVSWVRDVYVFELEVDEDKQTLTLRTGAISFSCYLSSIRHILNGIKIDDD